MRGESVLWKKGEREPDARALLTYGDRQEAEHDATQNPKGHGAQTEAAWPQHQDQHNESAARCHEGCLVDRP
eukprot:4357385-Prorocentrum_lima.AAC.1